MKQFPRFSRDFIDKESLQLVESYLFSSYRLLKQFESEAIQVIRDENEDSATSCLLTVLASFQVKSITNDALFQQQAVQLHEIASSTSKLMRRELLSMHRELNEIFETTIANNGENTKRIIVFETLDSNIIEIEKLWSLIEIITWLKLESFSSAFIDWLKNDYEDSLRINAIIAHVQSLPGEATATQYESSFHDLLQLPFKQALAWLAMRGHLDLIWIVIVQHPDINEIFRAFERNSSDMNPRYHSYLQELQQLQDILTAYASIDSGDHHTSTPSSPNSVSLFQQWKQRVNSFLAAKPTLLGGFPFLFDTLQILTGNEVSLLDQCLPSSSHIDQSREGSTWIVHLLATLLYKHSAGRTLTRTDFIRIIDKSYAAVSQRRHLSSRENDLYANISNAFNGSVTAVITRIYELSNVMVVDSSSTRVASEIGWKMKSALRVLSVASACHVSYVLSVSSVYNQDVNSPETSTDSREISVNDIYSNMNSVIKNLLLPVDTFPNEACFVEELMLETSELLATLSISPSVISGYLQSCPRQGRYFLSKLLTHIQPVSDSDVSDITRILRANNLNDEAKSMEIQRGMFWLNKSSLLYQVSYEKAGLYHPNSLATGSSSENMNNSINSDYFPAAKAVYFFELAQQTMLVKLVVEYSFIRCSLAVRSSESLFPGLIIHPFRPLPPNVPGSPWFVDNIKEYRVNKPITRLLSPEDHSNELLYALQEAQYILTSLFTRNESIRSPVAKGLKRYVKAIVLQLEATSFHHTIKAAKLLCSIALESLYPMRYWLHIVDLSVWFHRYYVDSASAAINESNHLNQSNAITDTSIEMKLELDGLNAPLTCFSKSQVYGLLSLLLQLTSSFLAPQFYNNHYTITTEGDIRSIRLELLSILTQAIYQENIEFGTKIVTEEREVFDRKVALDRVKRRDGCSEDELRVGDMVSGGFLDLF